MNHPYDFPHAHLITPHIPFSEVRTFQIYYGQVDTLVMNQLQAVDLVMLEPRQIDYAMVSELRAAGTRVFGYLSVMETPVWNQARFAKLDRADFLRIDGQVKHFPAWDSYLMDLRQAHYQELLFEEIRDNILAKQIDGILLDTVGDIEEYVPEGNVRREMAWAYRDFLQKLRRRAPSLHLIQNRGFDLLEQSLTELHGVLWEDWRGDLVHDAWVQNRLRPIEAYQQRGLKIFTVSAPPKRIHAEMATQRGFVHLSRPNGYNTL